MFILELKQRVKGLYKYLDKVDYDNALDDASRETGWTFPVSEDIKILWILKRATRHLYSYLLSESAHKFKYEQINLQQRYEHYRQLVIDFDKEFTIFVEERIDLFAGVDPFKMFATKIDAGFSYDIVGNEDTYNKNNEVIFTPTEND